MSYPGPPPPPYYGPPVWPPPPGHHPHHPPPPGHHPPGHPPGHLSGNQPYPYYVPGAVMIPFPAMPVAQAPSEPSQPTYITNYIYHGESQALNDQVQVVDNTSDHLWVSSTATTAVATLTGRAVVGGHEGWDGSPLWVIRAWHNGDLIPGKLSVRHNAASIMYDGKEVAVLNIEVLCARNLRWVPSSNGTVPPDAIPGGHTSSGETLYIGRARHQLSITPGKIHPSHGCCYIGFGGAEVAHKMYDVLCKDFTANLNR